MKKMRFIKANGNFERILNGASEFEKVFFDVLIFVRHLECSKNDRNCFFCLHIIFSDTEYQQIYGVESLLSLSGPGKWKPNEITERRM